MLICAFLVVLRLVDRVLRESARATGGYLRCVGRQRTGHRFAMFGPSGPLRLSPAGLAERQVCELQRVECETLCAGRTMWRLPVPGQDPMHPSDAKGGRWSGWDSSQLLAAPPRIHLIVLLAAVVGWGNVASSIIVVRAALSFAGVRGCA